MIELLGAKGSFLYLNIKKSWVGIYYYFMFRIIHNETSNRYNDMVGYNSHAIVLYLNDESFGTYVNNNLLHYLQKNCV